MDGVTIKTISTCCV